MAFTQNPVANSEAKAGSLIIAGSGIASVGQFTLETVQCIKQADKVFYAVPDPVTEAFIQENNENSVDLTVYYDINKTRTNSYVQMAEVMLKDVRQGYNVVGVLYGHPGVFVNPSHRALAIARSEGYRAKMLPGISAEDCLFADLGVDPATPGCLTYEATDLLLRKRPLNLSSHLVLWQVGAVGVKDLAMNNDHIALLVDRLEKEYGPEHPVFHYIAAVLPQDQPVIDRFAIADLHKPEVVRQFNAVSTFYLPPKAPASIHQPIAEAVGMLAPGQTPPTVRELSLCSAFRLSGLDLPVQKAYRDYELALIAEMENYTPPARHQVLRASPAMKDIMTRLALEPKLMAQYEQDRARLVASISGLTVEEKEALTAGDPRLIHKAMRRLFDDGGAASSIASQQAADKGNIGIARHSAETPLGKAKALILILILITADNGEGLLGVA